MLDNGIHQQTAADYLQLVFIQISLQQVASGGSYRADTGDANITDCLHDRILNRVSDTGIMGNLDAVLVSMCCFLDREARRAPVFLGNRVSQQITADYIQFII